MTKKEHKKNFLKLLIKIIFWSDMKLVNATRRFGALWAFRANALTTNYETTKQHIYTKFLTAHVQLGVWGRSPIALAILAFSTPKIAFSTPKIVLPQYF